MKEFKIGINDAGQHLHRFIKKAVPKLPNSLAEKYLRLGRFKIGGKSAKRDYLLSIGEIVQMYVNDEYFENKPQNLAYAKIKAPNLDIVYEDDNILLLNKPAGLLCHSDSSNNPNTLISGIHAYLHETGQWFPNEENSFRPALCNRLDRNTSGIVIAAKNAHSLRKINEKLRLREIDKHYLAVVHGTPDPPSRRLEGNLVKESKINQAFMNRENHANGKSALLEFNTIVSVGELSLLDCLLITGRPHQIRVQLADIGHPLLGDRKYGDKAQQMRYPEKYQALCSYKLVFSFKSDAGILQYLDKCTFEISDIPFVEKYF